MREVFHRGPFHRPPVSGAAEYQWETDFPGYFVLIVTRLYIAKLARVMQ